MTARIKLLAPPPVDERAIQEHAERILRDGQGATHCLATMRRVAEIAKARGVEVEFYREEPGGEVTFDLEDMEVVFRRGIEIRPRQ